MEIRDREHFLPWTRATKEMIIISIISLITLYLASYFDIMENLQGLLDRYEYRILDEIILLFIIVSVSMAIIVARRFQAFKHTVLKRNWAEDILQCHEEP